MWNDREQATLRVRWTWRSWLADNIDNGDEESVKINMGMMVVDVAYG